MPRLDRSAQAQRPAVPLAGEARTLPDLFARRAKATPDAFAWKTKRGGAWVGTTWRDAYGSVAALATWLAANGIGLGDKVCIIGSTRAEWCLSDMGGMLAGMYAALYPSRVRSLTMLCPAGLSMPVKSDMVILNEQGKQILYAHKPDELEEMFSYISHQPMPSFPKFLVNAIATERVRMHELR